MGNDFAKRLLERANTFELRQKAIRAAMGLGMPLCEIEQYLDWLDSRPSGAPDRDEKPQVPPPHVRQRDTEKQG